MGYKWNPFSTFWEPFFSVISFIQLPGIKDHHLEPWRWGTGAWKCSANRCLWLPHISPVLLHLTSASEKRITLSCLSHYFWSLCDMQLNLIQGTQLKKCFSNSSREFSRLCELGEWSKDAGLSPPYFHLSQSNGVCFTFAYFTHWLRSCLRMERLDALQSPIQVWHTEAFSLQTTGLKRAQVHEEEQDFSMLYP